jgi:hypothetical protein
MGVGISTPMARIQTSLFCLFSSVKEVIAADSTLHHLAPAGIE